MPCVRRSSRPFREIDMTPATKKSSTKQSRMRAAASKQAPGLFSQRGVVTAPRSRAELKHLKWDSVELERLNPLLQRQFIVGRDIMIARVLLQNCLLYTSDA